MNDIIRKARALMNVLSDEVEDYPDLSAFRQMRDRSNDLVVAIQEFEKKEINQMLNNGEEQYVTLNTEECEALKEILQKLELITLRNTGMKNINGGYAKAEMLDYDEKQIDIELEWGEQDMGDGDSYSCKETYTLDRDVILQDIDIMEKFNKIKEK